jgi:hypothetical protein
LGKWFIDACKLIFEKVTGDQYVFFYQTDRKREGGLIDKSHLVNLAARESNMPLKWHKVVLKRDVGKVDLHRPTFTHLLCYSRTLGSGKATPDVIQCGEMLYKNAMGFNAVKLCLDLIGDRSNTIFDPFCGQGSVLELANQYGKDAIGIDILPEQCVKACGMFGEVIYLNDEIEFKLDE